MKGNPRRDNQGQLLFEPTEFKTDEGEVVSRPQCDFGEDWENNNEDSYEVTLPIDGEGYVTADCENGELGPLRNCGFKKGKVKECDPGETVRLTCKTKGDPQVLRVCETSTVLDTAIPCTYNGPHKC